MRFIETFSLLALSNSAVCFAAAFAFGTLIGAERQYRQRSAALRTNVLVAVGAAAFVDFGIRVAGPGLDASHGLRCRPRIVESF
jgi:putative Mg2+ transporter-C (MgtC) family protein